MLDHKLRVVLVSFVSALALAGAGIYPSSNRAADATTGTAAPVDEEDLRDELTLQQKRVWRALQRRDAEAFRQLVPADFVGINRDGVRYGREEGLQFIAGYKIASFDLSDVRVQSVNRDAAVLTYHVKYRIASIGGDEILDLSMRNVAVFARRDSKWYCVFGQETPVGTDPATTRVPKLQNEPVPFGPGKLTPG